MVVYTVATIISVFFSMLTLKYKKNGKYTNKAITCVLLSLSALPLVIITSIRYDVGQDYFYTYVPYFNNLLINNINENVEIGYYYLNKFVQLFTTDYVWIFTLCSLIFFYFVYRGIYDQSENLPLSVCLLVITGYYFIFLNTMRQSLSVAIIFYALKYVKQRNFGKYAIFTLIACLIHSSAIYSIPIYFIYGIKIKPKMQIILIAIIIVFKQILGSFISNLVVQSKYSAYLGLEAGQNVAGGTITIAIDIVVLMFSWIYFNKESLYINKKEFYFHSNLQLISTIIGLLSGIAPLINRLRWYYSFEIILFIPLILALEKNEKNRYIEILVIVAAFSIYCFITVGINNSNIVLPYQTIFNVIR